MSYQNGAVFDGAAHEDFFMSNGWSLAEVDHRVANSFSLLASTVSNQARYLAKQPRMMSSDEVSRLLKEVGSRIAAVGQLHREISTRPEELQLDLNEHLWRMCDELIAALAPPGQFELIRSVASPCAIQTKQVLPICLIVTEIVTNSLKYAHPTGVRGSVTIGCRREADGSVFIEVADDGVGLPDGFDPAVDGGLGSQTVTALTKQLRGESSFVSGPIGLRFQLRLPPSTMQ